MGQVQGFMLILGRVGSRKLDPCPTLCGVLGVSQCSLWIAVDGLLDPVDVS